MKIIIKNGRVIDPANGIDKITDILVENETITALGKFDNGADSVINADGKIVSPGFIDLHVHFRSPGQEHKEDFATGSQAAAAGGFTTVCPMANTSPVIDSPELIHNAINNAKKLSSVRILPVGAITKGLNGVYLVNVKAMLESGAIAFSEDGKSVADETIKKAMLLESKKYGFPVICHCEDPHAPKGVVNAGMAAETLGVPGIPVEVEDSIVERDIRLAKETGGHAHITHVSSGNSIDLIRKAKKEGIHVTCDVTPHHFSLDDSYVLNGNTDFKMNPPLRSKKDVERIIEGIIDGTVDCIATDHAPHAAEEKNTDIIKAPFGIIGLESALAIGVTYLVKPQIISWTRLIELYSYHPSKILQIDGGNLTPGNRADITLFDPDKEILITDTFFKSKSKNSPYIGMKLTGLVTNTLVAGKEVFNFSDNRYL